MSITFDLEHQELKYDQQNETAMFTLSAPTMEDISRLPPQNVCFVVDISGSMNAHERAIKNALLMGIDKLRDVDQVSILTYSDTVTVLCEWNTVTEALKKMVKDRVAGVRCGGGTNISGALFQAIDQSYKLETKNATVIFFTDGKANKGVTDVNRLGMMVKNILGSTLDEFGLPITNDRKTSIHTLGFGSSHERVFLETISNVANGKYNYIENDDHLADAFQDIIGDTLEIALQNVKLTLESDDVNFNEYEDNTELNELKLDDAICGRPRQYLVTLNFIGEKKEYDISYTLSAINVLSGEKISVENKVRLLRGDDNHVNSEVTKRKKELLAVKAIQQAREKAEKGKMNEAFNLIHETSLQMDGLPNVRNNLNVLSQDLLAPNLYMQRGNFRMSSVERGLSENTNSYFTRQPEQILGLSPIKMERKLSITPTTTPTSLNSGATFGNHS